MVRTRNTNDEEAPARDSSAKATWEEQLTLQFCDLCAREVEAGNRPTTHLSPTGWDNVVTLFQARTGKAYGKSQLKNRWGTMKKEWKLWNSLIKGETGLGWDEKRKTIAAPSEWWAQKIKANPAVRIFRKKGISEEVNDRCWIMFGDTVATGDGSKGVLPCESSEQDSQPIEGSGDSDNRDAEINLNVASQPENDGHRPARSSNQGKQWMKSVRKPRRKQMKPKKSNGSKFSGTLSSGRKSLSTIEFTRPLHGAAEAITALDAMGDQVPKQSSLYYFALKIFKDPYNREVFLSLDEGSRFWWLNLQYDENQQLQLHLSHSIAGQDHHLR